MNALSPPRINIAARKAEERNRWLMHIDALNSALVDLEIEAKFNPFGVGESLAYRDTLRAMNVLTATDAFAEHIEEIERDHGSEAA